MLVDNCSLGDNLGSLPRYCIFNVYLIRVLPRSVDADGTVGIGVGGEEGGNSEDGGASNLSPLALHDPLKVIERSSRFQ